MKFSVIGNNKSASRLIQELTESQEHTLVVGAVYEELADSIVAERIPFHLAPTPEDAILEGRVECVIISLDDTEEILRLCRATAQAGKHVVVIPPAEASPAFSFELHLILDESSHAIIPLTGRFLLQELPVEKVDFGFSRNDVVQICCEMDCETTTKKHRDIQIVKGLDILCACGFHYTQVTALESNAPDGSLLSLLITLSSQAAAEQNEPPATLTIKPSSVPPLQPGAIQIHQTDGRLKAILAAERTPALPKIEWFCHSPKSCSNLMESFSETLELAEAVKKSLRRRRTVDVHFDSGSERGVFKSQMTAVGCGVLTFMMFGMVAYLVIAQLVELPKWILHIARALWIAPLVLFLLAQALLPIARDRSAEK